MEVDGLLLTPKCVEGDAEVVAARERVGVVRTQHAFAVGEGLLVEDGGLLMTAKQLQGDAEAAAAGQGVGVVRAEVVGFGIEDALAQEVVFGCGTRILEGVGEVGEQVADGGEVGAGCAVQEGWQVWGEEACRGPAGAARIGGVLDDPGEAGVQSGVTGGAVRAGRRGESDDIVDQGVQHNLPDR